MAAKLCAAATPIAIRRRGGLQSWKLPCIGSSILKKNKMMIQVGRVPAVPARPRLVRSCHDPPNAPESMTLSQSGRPTWNSTPFERLHVHLHLRLHFRGEGLAELCWAVLGFAGLTPLEVRHYRPVTLVRSPLWDAVPSPWRSSPFVEQMIQSLQSPDTAVAHGRRTAIRSTTSTAS